MRDIKHIVIHCTAGPQNQRVQDIQAYWRNSLGWTRPGYHIIIRADGSTVRLQDNELPTNGVAGHNANSIHISYLGGVDRSGHPVDNRTQAQKLTMARLIKRYLEIYPKARVCGHRDFPNVKKACPSFDVSAWMETAEYRGLV